MDSDDGCFATTFERKYYHHQGTFTKRSLRPQEFRTAHRGVRIPRLNKERLMNEAASRHYLREYTGIPVPEQNIIVNPETLKISAVIDWEYVGFHPPDIEWPFYTRLGPSSAVNDEVDGSPQLLEFLVSQVFKKPDETDGET
ncbi:hypothetical protein FZEAL_3622 [Fusarium zealandicum]|uniref:Aminoglycoside phosphotransferase domain-containing protein n=1 Tax=Fusarium zealandicum TaxID=1053134 RepID=A0A8H4UP14_9HYPO|nr:hypothetical protein FZEAL_3622 [Fusarium zealandicum]